MQVRDVMTEDPACCAPETPIREAAKLMAECDCGEIPVLEHFPSRMTRGDSPEAASVIHPGCR